MNALLMLKTAKRYCKTQAGCINCGIGSDSCLSVTAPQYMREEQMALIAEFLEAWAKEHPLKTRTQLFLERNPDAGTIDGIPGIKPCDYLAQSEPSFCKNYARCSECTKEYWEELVDEEG